MLRLCAENVDANADLNDEARTYLIEIHYARIRTTPRVK